MSEQKMLELTKRHEWMWKGKAFGIMVSCHRSGDGWTWCLYALIYDNHPLFKDPEAAVDQLSWHCGSTYDERFTQEPARGIRYDWQRKGEWLKVGCDYAHIYDGYEQRCCPDDGIPATVARDAQVLFDELRAREAS